MLEMLREGLNHHDRIPHPTGALPLSSWVRHIVDNYKRLPDYLFFAPAAVPVRDAGERTRADPPSWPPRSLCAHGGPHTPLP